MTFQTSELAQSCLDCGYPREGLAALASCPECGASAAPPNWLIVRGWSLAFGGAVLVVAGLFLLLMSVGLAWEARRVGDSLVEALPCTLCILVPGAAPLVLGWWQLRARPRGGDVIWIVAPDRLEIRTRGLVEALSWSEVGACSLTRNVFSGRIRLLAAPRGPWLAARGNKTIWLGRSLEYATAVRDLIRARTCR